MFNELLRDISQTFNSTVFIKILLTAVVGMTGFIIKMSLRMIKDIRYMKIYQQAIDYALEKCFGNGYANYRNEKLNNLMEREKFIK
ncbi:MAG: hypothetical protein FJ216_10470 [Ignavibacteria bacterium]|nr:hypothetical protein [Ignavibacteria bacterium]